MSAESQFQAAIAATGMTPPDAINADGQIHRWNGTDKRGNTRNSWYSLHLDGTPAGSFGDWAGLEKQCWCAKRDHDLTDNERQVMRDRIKAANRQRDAERDRIHAEAATRAVAIWTAAAPALDHPYLELKAVKAHGIRTDGQHLLIPRRDTAGKLWSLQTINASGEKRFMPGGRVTGTYFSIGHPAGTVIVCEGVATGATLNESTGCAVAVAFSAGNLMAVALALRAKYQDMELTIAADDDFLTVGNPGMTAARAAAAAVGAKLAIPNFDGLVRGIKDTDFNDVARLLNEQGAAS